MPDTPCAMNVAQATPATPIFIGPANIKSSAILVREEKIKKYNGVFESPRAVKTAVLILYINRKYFLILINKMKNGVKQNEKI